MFDIGFWELALIGVVALLVVGPDRLPALARTVGLWVGRIRRYVSTVRDDIEREIQADELRSMLNKSDELNPLKDIIDETTGTISDANKEIAGVRKDAEKLMSADSDIVPGSVSASGGEDETAADTSTTPEAAATAVAEAVSSRTRDAAQTQVETSESDVEGVKGDEQRSS